MKDYQKFRDKLIAIAIIYDKELPQAVFDIYWEALNEHDDEIVHKALSEGVKLHWKWLPKPAEINCLIKEIEHREWMKAREFKDKEKNAWRQSIYLGEGRGQTRLEQAREIKALPEKVNGLVVSLVSKMDANKKARKEKP